MPTRLIAHRIEKKQHSAAVNPILRDALIPADKLSLDLISVLRSAITSKNPVAARFTRHSGAQPEFEQRLRSYLARMSDREFVAYTQDATKHLAREMVAEQLATGGYVVFAEHEDDGSNYLVVVLLSTRAQPSFDERLNLVASTTLDIEHLRHAGRVRLESVPNNDDGVVHVVSRAEAVSDYFRLFLGVVDVTDSTVQGNLLHSAIRGLAGSGETDVEGPELLQRAYSYWQDCRSSKRPMKLSDLAKVLDPGNSDSVLAYLGQEKLGLAGEFTVPPASVMRRFVKFAFNRSGLKLEFDRTDWLGKITVKGRAVVINNAPQDLINQISEEKNEQ